LRSGYGFFEPLAGDAVDGAVGRRGDNLMTALAQNGDGLRADQAGGADNGYLNDSSSILDNWRLSDGFEYK
jgi:hypothetical protein